MADLVYRGQQIRCEPHIFGRSARTGAFWLKAFDLEAEAWRYFSFCEIKDFETRQSHFTPRAGFRDGERKICTVDTDVH